MRTSINKAAIPCPWGRNTHAASLRCVAVLVALSLYCFHGASAEIYKQVDANGNVSFTDVAPVGNNRGKVVAIETDEANANIVETSADSQRATSEFLQKRAQKRQEEASKAQALSAWRKELKAAQLELKLARQAKADGVVVEEGDFVGKAGGGARPSPSYFAKLEQLDARVSLAEQKLATVRHAKPK